MAHSRWTDNPFRRPDITPEELAWIEKRNEATRIFQETGDDTMAIEIGLFPPRKDGGGGKEVTPTDEGRSAMTPNNIVFQCRTKCGKTTVRTSDGYEYIVWCSVCDANGIYRILDDGTFQQIPKPQGDSVVPEFSAYFISSTGTCTELKESPEPFFTN